MREAGRRRGWKAFWSKWVPDLSTEGHLFVSLGPFQCMEQGMRVRGITDCPKEDSDIHSGPALLAFSPPTHPPNFHQVFPDCPGSANYGSVSGQEANLVVLLFHSCVRVWGWVG